MQQSLNPTSGKSQNFFHPGVTSLQAERYKKKRSFICTVGLTLCPTQTDNLPTPTKNEQVNPLHQKLSGIQTRVTRFIELDLQGLQQFPKVRKCKCCLRELPSDCGDLLGSWVASGIFGFRRRGSGLWIQEVGFRGEKREHFLPYEVSDPYTQEVSEK